MKRTLICTGILVAIFILSGHYSLAKDFAKAVSISAPGVSQKDFSRNAVSSGLDVVKQGDRLRPVLPGAGEVFFPLDLAAGSNRANYLIIAAQPFYSSPALLELAQHRADYNGFDVAVVSTNAVYAAVGNVIPQNNEIVYTGDNNGDTQALEIKTFLKYVFEHWNDGAPALQYVLLVGDAYPATAAWYLPAYYTSMDVPTDYWYSCVTDDNGNLPINELDRNGDFPIGRFSVQNQNELANVVLKTKAYEDAPADGDWSAKVLMSSGFALNDEIQSHWPEIINNLVDRNRKEFNEIDIQDNSDNGLLTIAQMKADINGGRGLVAHNSHGSQLTWLMGSASFTESDIRSLTNAGKLPVILSMACKTAAYDFPHDWTWGGDPNQQSFGELFVNSCFDDGCRNNGAVAFVGASRETQFNPNENLADQLLAAILTENILILGDAVLAAKSNMVTNTEHRFRYNLLGDPALHMVIGDSQKPELSCAISGFIPSSEEYRFRIRIENNGLGAVANAPVELFEGDPEQGGTRIAETEIDMEGDSEEMVEVSVPRQEGWAPGTGTDLYCVVDRDTDPLGDGNYGEIDERYEENNAGNLPFYIETNYEDVAMIATGNKPAIDGNKIVWQDERRGDMNIYLYNLGPDGVFGTQDDSLETNPQRQVTSSAARDSDPAIYANTIAWAQLQPDSKSRLFTYRLGGDGLFGTSDDIGVSAITSAASNAQFPAIYNNALVWQEYLGGNLKDVFHYAPPPPSFNRTLMPSGGIHRVAEGNPEAARPDIWSRYIVWESKRGAFYDILSYDLGLDRLYGTPDDGGLIPVDNGDWVKLRAKIDANKIVWEDYRNGNNNKDIMLYDIASGQTTAVVNNSSSQTSPDISGSRIVWEDSRAGNKDIRITDLQNADFQDVALTDNPLSEEAPKISGDKVVYQQDGRIYLIRVRE
ncbi:MAG TPA: C25 family cysteine peptidase [Candidatus Omnitrophota bacterium]|nr:C25 family cysteine peptidase [Candidatus Omnitrophota bacterium]HPD84601.1 C25 family cysteine peptidase [Candidatus Omnitrophota bacterium]HRZ03459.1 C25 family cysteine peptidase [Candidatus Omnitrophota bacterium]